MPGKGQEVVPSPACLTIAGAATYLGTTDRHVRDLVYRRRIPFVKVGRLVRFRLTDLEQWLAANTVPAESGAA